MENWMFLIKTVPEHQQVSLTPPQGGISTLVVYITTEFQNTFLSFLCFIAMLQEQGTHFYKIIGYSVFGQYGWDFPPVSGK
jgi:hypothetical protein